MNLWYLILLRILISHLQLNSSVRISIKLQYKTLIILYTNIKIVLDVNAHDILLNKSLMCSYL
jgi:hypothetical protein